MERCRICGWQGMAPYHKGAIDCINQYRALVEDLRSQLPQGKQVMVSSIERGVSAQVWINGEITFKGLDRLITMIRFMQEAWTEEMKNEGTEPCDRAEVPVPVVSEGEAQQVVSDGN